LTLRLHDPKNMVCTFAETYCLGLLVSSFWSKLYIL